MYASALAPVCTEQISDTTYELVPQRIIWVHKSAGVSFDVPAIAAKLMEGQLGFQREEKIERLTRHRASGIVKNKHTKVNGSKDKKLL